MWLYAPWGSHKDHSVNRTGLLIDRDDVGKVWCATKRATEALVGTTGAKTSYKGRRLHLGGDHGSCMSITLVTTGPGQSKHRNSKAPERSLRGFAIAVEPRTGASGLPPLAPCKWVRSPLQGAAEPSRPTALK